MKDFAIFALSNFTLTFLVAGVIAAGIDLARQARPRPRGAVPETLLAWFLFFSIGVSFFYDFVMHVFFGAMAAAFIGWTDSPFQAEVGYASLGFAATGFLAFRGQAETRLAAILGTGSFSGARRSATSSPWCRPTTSRPATPASPSGPMSSCP